MDYKKVVKLETRKLSLPISWFSVVIQLDEELTFEAYWSIVLSN